MDEKKETVSQQTEYERDRRKGGLGDWKAIIIALIAGITAIICVVIFSGNLMNYKKTAGAGGLTATGSANLDFESDLIVWRGNFSTYGATPKEAYAVIKRDSEIVKDYLLENGVSEDELVFSSVDISQRYSKEYDENGNYIRDYPDGYEDMIQEETVGRGEQKADLVSLLKDRRFILVCAGMSCISFIGCSLYHISSYVQSLGYDARFGATVISIYNFVCIFSKMIMGRLFDRKGLKAGILFGALGICGSYFLMALSVFWSSAWFLVVIALFYGIGNTCQSITAPSLVSGVFGVRNYSEVYAKISTVTMVVGAVSTPVLSAIYEASGSYLTAWIVCLILSFV